MAGGGRLRGRRDARSPRRRARAHGAPFFAAALIAASLLAPGCRCSDLASPVVHDFESGAGLKKWPRDAPGAVEISTDWKADGEASLRIDPGLLASIGELRRYDLRGHDALRVHVHNTSDRLAPVGFELIDEHDTLYDRHRSAIGAPPGDSVIEIDLSGDLWRGEENRPYRGPTKTPIDLGDIHRIGFENHGDRPIYLDGLTLVAHPLPVPAGAFAFDFGRRGSRVMGKTTGVFEGSTYDAARGFGFVSGAPTFLQNTMSYPSPLLGDGLAWGDAVFQVDLPGGSYTAWIAFERGGFWGTDSEATAYREARLLVNGEVAHRHWFTVIGPQFSLQETEVTKVADAREKLVWPAHAVHRFTFDARPGPNLFSLAVTDLRGPPLRVAGMFLAPATAEGKAFIDAQEERQKRAFEAAYPESDHARRPAKPIPLEHPVVVEPRPVGELAHPRDLPDAAFPDPPPIHAIAGHRAYAQLSLYAPRNIEVGVHVTFAEVPGEIPDPGKAPAEVPGPRVSVERLYQAFYGPTRPNMGGTAWIETHYLRPIAHGDVVHVGPDLHRSIVVEFTVPKEAPAGVSSVFVKLLAGGEEIAEVPLTVNVHAVELPPLPIPVGVFMNALPHAPEDDLEDIWWVFQEQLLERQGEAGLNTPTGGAGLEYTMSETTGGITFSGDRALRYLGLAKRYGLDRAVVGYTGFLPSIKHRRPDAARFVAAWAAFEAARGLPPHYLYSYDEPSTDEELSAVSAYLLPFQAAGARTIGFFSSADDDRYRTVLDRTFAPAVCGHTPERLRGWIAEGRRVFLYNRGTSRLSMGADLASMIELGIAGRLEWIGLYSQGFAFNDLDGREPSQGMFVAHGRMGALPTARWLSFREGLIDARILLALRKKLGSGAAAAAGFPADYPADPAKWPDSALEKARGEALRRLEEPDRP